MTNEKQDDREIVYRSKVQSGHGRLKRRKNSDGYLSITVAGGLVQKRSID